MPGVLREREIVAVLVGEAERAEGEWDMAVVAASEPEPGVLGGPVRPVLAWAGRER